MVALSLALPQIPNSFDLARNLRCSRDEENQSPAPNIQFDLVPRAGADRRVDP
jgi:hypothetical protein